MSIALIQDRINVAQDAPFALGVAVWFDRLKQQPDDLQNAAAYIRAPGSTEPLVCTPDNGRLLITANMAVIQLGETDLAELPAGRLYVELQWQDAAGAQGRADFEAVYLIAGEGSAFTNAQALGLIYDVEFVAQRGSGILGIAGGPPGPPQTSTGLLLSTAAQQALGVDNVDAAILKLFALISGGVEPGVIGSTDLSQGGNAAQTLL